MNVSYKDLALLHLRDPANQPFRPLADLLNDNSAAITWSTLQRVLRNDGLDSRVLQLLEAQGRLDTEKLEFGLHAQPFLREARRSRWPDGFAAVYEDIYEVVWRFGGKPDLQIQTQGLYRGQWDSRWSQVSTLLREPLTVQTLSDRVAKTQMFVDELRSGQDEFFAAPPSDDDLVAVAQHYGFPTPMLDYTTSLGVAAFFATARAAQMAEGQSVLGAVLKLRWRPESDDILSIADNPGIAGFHLLDSARVRIGHARYVRPNLADVDNRIARQRGLFVSGFQARDLHGVGLSVLFFWQRPGEVFEDPHDDVTAAYLLPDETPLARFAAAVSKRWSEVPPLSIVAGIGATEFAVLPVVGSAGFSLQGTVTDARRFFKGLEARVARLRNAGAVRHALEEVFDEYFRLCQLRSDLGQLPIADSRGGANGRPEAPWHLDPFGFALSKLAHLCGWTESELENAVEVHVSVNERGFRRWPESLLRAREATTDAERLAVGCAVFLASWEVLQHVRGDVARDVTVKASVVLSPLEEFVSPGELPVRRSGLST